MANKYIRHGETYCGDGTTSAAAASNGAAGAWNNINVLTGTAPAYGVLAAGDVVYIRSKNASNTNISIALAANVTIGSASASIGNWIKWIIDGGSVWPGVSGVLSITSSAASRITYNAAYNEFAAEQPDAFQIINTSNNPDTWTLSSLANFVGWNMLFDACSVQGAWGNGIGIVIGASVQMHNCHFKVGPKRSDGFFYSTSDAAELYLVNPSIELVHSNANAVFRGQANNVAYRVYGGEVTGAGATSGVPLIASNGGFQFEALGLQYPKTMTFSNAALPTALQAWTVGADGGAGGVICARWGTANSRTDGFYPTLNATLPDSESSPWSWWVYPSAAAIYRPAALPAIKYFTDTAAAKTITLDFLVADTFSGLDTSKVWMDVSYIDHATGAVKACTTKALAPGTALTTSTAAWSATTYGAVNLLKRKLSVTTPTSIKQNTAITVRFYFAVPSATANDIIFVDPDVQLS